MLQTASLVNTPTRLVGGYHAPPHRERFAVNCPGSTSPPEGQNEPRLLAEGSGGGTRSSSPGQEHQRKRGLQASDGVLSPADGDDDNPKISRAPEPAPAPGPAPEQADPTTITVSPADFSGLCDFAPTLSNSSVSILKGRIGSNDNNDHFFLTAHQPGKAGREEPPHVR